MIDTASYLNSKDIAEHWRKIGFVCTPLQSAYLVWHNRTKTLAEKHAAWHEIIRAMSDCPVAAGHRKANMGISESLAGSLHGFLQTYMRLQNKLVEQFYKKGDHAVYRYCVLYEGDEDWSRDSLLYDRAEECFEDITADAELFPSLRCIQITKQWIGEIKAITLSVKADKTVLQLDADGLEEPDMNLLQVFEWMWFDFPTPFKRGDIVVSIRSAITSMGTSLLFSPIYAAGEASSCGRTDILIMIKDISGRIVSFYAIGNAQTKRI